MPFAGGYRSETDDIHHCYINQFGIYFGENNQTQKDDDDDDDSPINMPSPGTNWLRSCMEAKYRTFVTLQQMIEFAFIGGLASFFSDSFSFLWSDEKTAGNSGQPKLLPASDTGGVEDVCNAKMVKRSWIL